MCRWATAYSSSRGKRVCSSSGSYNSSFWARWATVCSSSCTSFNWAHTLGKYSSGPLVRNSNLGLVLIPYRASQFQYNFLSVSSWWRRKKRQFLVTNFQPRWCLTCPLACQVTTCWYNLFTSASDTFFLCRYSMWSGLVQFTGGSARQTTPCVTSTVASRC